MRGEYPGVVNNRSPAESDMSAKIKPAIGKVAGRVQTQVGKMLVSRCVGGTTGSGWTT